ncbi:hypothetical protein HELRODRAFT_170043 [Helobdella robusta]|uniref:Uncharacterized protein n=1 Tax=Helobdella robusta TaxID=6412 RepID=T1F2K7_HELRO|nr:hypothetical protein HELRODRAFT_170043 [Helobdella robusta]ESO07506.1 hypothetical protein HELRODRAFT_170043 [Helobdella robusta]
MIFSDVPHASGQCTFPEFLWKQSSREHLSHIINSNFKNLNHNNFSKTWITEEVHTSKSRKFKSRKLIAATRSTLVISVQDQGFCKTGGTCEMEERVITTMKCYKDVGNQTFKVMRSDEGFVS